MPNKKFFIKDTGESLEDIALSSVHLYTRQTLLEEGFVDDTHFFVIEVVGSAVLKSRKVATLVVKANKNG